jgi:predicted dehydrogenase
MTAGALGVGVVGLGFMGRRHARFISRLEGARLAGVCDLDAALANEVAAACGGRVYADAASLAGAPDVAAVIVCTPEDHHVAPALAALTAGKPLLVEKPVAHSLDAARSIVAAAERSGVPVVVGHLLRFEPRWVAAHQRLEAGAIGDVVSIATRRVGNVLDQQVLRGRTTIPLYYGVHDLDVMRWFAASEATRIYAERRSGALRAQGYDLDDLYCAVLSFESGVLGSAELGWHIPANAIAARTSGVVVVGTRGVIRIEQGETGIECWMDGGMERGLDATFWQEGYDVPGGALGLEIRHFLDCVRGRREPAIALADAVEALRLALAMEASADQGKPIVLKEFDRP